LASAELSQVQLNSPPKSRGINPFDVTMAHEENTGHAASWLPTPHPSRKMVARAIMIAYLGTEGGGSAGFRGWSSPFNRP
jgi:hypothetical protein